MKKQIKNIFLLILILLVSLITFACTGSPGGGTSSGDDWAGSMSGGEGAGSSGEGGEINSIYEITQDEIYEIQAGQITAMEWSDCENFSDWLTLVSPDEQGTSSHGKFYESYNKLNNKTSLLNARQIVTFKINSNEQPLINAKVKLTSLNGDLVSEAVTNMNGIAYLQLKDDFESCSLNLSIFYNQQTYNQVIDLYKNQTSFEVNLENVVMAPAPKKLDLLFTIDTTGSMGDEIAYLQAELRDVISKLSDLGIEIRLGLLFYRDIRDNYTTRDFDFTNDIDAQITNLSKESANGGGDWEEAVDIAYEQATQFSWQEDSIKLMFHVADAPPHFTEHNLSLMMNSVKAFARMGVRVIPVTCSGIDTDTEVLYRIASIVTGGTYTYITDHSGIGNDHHESTTGATVVELLNEMLIRLIKEYCTGEDIEPVSYIKVYVAKITFDSVGGSAVNSVFLLKGKCITALQEPTKENHEFLGWYYQEGDVEKPFTLETIINDDLTVYAKWKEIINQEGSN